jgi:hypothetical protein
MKKKLLPIRFIDLGMRDFKEIDAVGSKVERK